MKSLVDICYITMVLNCTVYHVCYRTVISRIASTINTCNLVNQPLMILCEGRYFEVGVASLVELAYSWQALVFVELVFGVL